MATRNPASPRNPFSLDALRLPLAGLGALGLLAGVFAWLINGQFDLLPRILVAAGVLLLGIYVALDPEDVWGRVTGRSALYSGNTLVIAAAALVILGLVNVIGSRYQTKWDLSASQQFTLSDQSIRLAQSLQDPVHATVYMGPSDSRKNDYQTRLNDYQARSNGKFTYEFVDPETHPGEARAAGITDVGTTVYQMGDKKQNSTGTAERDISLALVKLTRPQKKLYFTTGHGERNLDGTDQQGYSQLKSSVERDNFSTATLNLAASRAVPDDAAEVIIAGPTNPFLPEEKDTLRAYLDGGGKVFLLVDPGSKADFNDILQKWEVAITGNVVIDPSSNLLGDIRVPLVVQYASHDSVKNLSGVGTFYPFTTNITYPQPSGGGATVTAIAQSSDQSWGNTNQQQIIKQDSDPKGPLALVVAVEQPAQSPGAPATRVYVMGNSGLVSNNSFQVSSGNTDLFLDAADWLAQEDNLINVRAPDTTPRSMLLSGTQQNLVTTTSLLGLPLLVLLAGAFVWWTRR
jgi:gliding motility-associatede transport system auxiliary component